jgi:hypothetical protein
MRLDLRHDPPKHRRRYDMHLIQQDEPPLARCEEVHHLLTVVRTFLSVRDHRVGGDDDAGFAGELCGTYTVKTTLYFSQGTGKEREKERRERRTFSF